MAASSKQQDLRTALEGHQRIQEKTIQALIAQDIELQQFYKLTKEDLREDFRESITVGQRNYLLEIIEQNRNSAALTNVNDEVPTEYSTLLSSSPSTANATSSSMPPSNSEQSNIIDLGCEPLQDVLSTNNSASGSQSQDTHPLTFAIRKRSLTSTDHNNKKSSNDCSAKKIVVDVKQILLSQNRVKGNEIIDFITEKQYVTRSVQSEMLEMLCEWIKDNNPFSLWPKKDLKVAVANGIVKAFPSLADDDGGSTSWYDPVSNYGLLQTKLQTMIRRTPQDERRIPYRQRKSPTNPVIEATAAKATTPTWIVTPIKTKQESYFLQYAIPDKDNKARIAKALAETFEERKEWIDTCHPTATDILKRYKHLISYGGDLIHYEFLRREPDSVSFVEEFKGAVHKVLEYAADQKVPDVEFGSETLKAMVLLPKLLPLPMKMSKQARYEVDNDINVGAKQFLLQVPCSALLQIVPEGTDVDFYQSIEVPKGDTLNVKPVPPYILWVTSDRKEGEFYIKIDRKISIHVTPKPNEETCLAALDLLFKVHTVFMLKYHPFMEFTFNFMECMSKIKNSKAKVCVANLLRVVRASKCNKIVSARHSKRAVRNTLVL